MSKTNLEHTPATPTGELPPSALSDGEPLPLPDFAQRGLVFLSHSSRIKDADELDPVDSYNQHLHRKKFLASLLQHCQTELEQHEFDVWWDRLNLRGGDRFDAMIHDALNLCDAAVVYVDRDALTSEYVRREVTILAFRAWTEALPIVPVLLGGVTDQELAQSPLGRNTELSMYLPIRPSPRRWNQVATKSIGMEVAREVNARLERNNGSSSSVTKKWIEDLSHALKELSPDHLWRAAEHLAENRQSWRRNRRQVAALSASLLTCDNLEQVHAAVSEIAHLLDPHARHLVTRLVRPLWVDLDTARIVQDVSRLPGERRVVGVSTRAYRLSYDVCMRATSSAPRYRTFRVSDVTGESALQELVDRYDRTIRNELNLFPSDDAQLVADDLQKLPGVYALLRCDTFDIATTLAVIENLQARFPGITFVLLAAAGSAVWKKLPMEGKVNVFERNSERAARQYVSDISRLSGQPVTVTSDD